MPPRPRWWHMLQAAKNEARLAVDLYNRQGNERQLEAFLVHMAMAWLKLMQAHTQQAGGDLFIRDKAGRRVRHEDGDWRYKASSQLLKENFADSDARRVNISSSPASGIAWNTATRTTLPQWSPAVPKRTS